MKAIETKRLPCTNTKPARIKATALGGFSVVISYPMDAEIEAMAHYMAVLALVKKYNLCWNVSRMVYGATEKGLVFCFPESVIETVK